MWSKNYSLYLVLDRDVCDYGRLWDVLKASVRGGVDIVQLRDKRGSAREILEFSEKAIKFLRGRVPFIINDRVDLALAARADGVHLGQDDIPVAVGRKILGRKALIGVSCQRLEHLRSALRNGADYVGFGSIFKTKTKPHRHPMSLALLEKAVMASKIPLFAIGGINSENLKQIDVRGVHHVAVCRTICLADNVEKMTRDLKERLAWSSASTIYKRR